MKTIANIKNYFGNMSPDYSYPQPSVYRGFAELVYNEEGDLACLSLSAALQRYIDLKSSEIYYSDSSWSKIDLVKLIEFLDKFGTGELKPEEHDFGI